MVCKTIVRFFVISAGYVAGAYFGFLFSCSLAKRLILNPTSRFWARKDRAPPAVLSDPDLGTHVYLQLQNGPKLHYVEKGDRCKPLMLLIHGFPEFWYSWRHQIREFSTDYWVVAVDMRGYGESDKPNGRKNYTVELIVSDMIKLLDELGKKTCTLVAHDWGGIIAWFMVLKYPEMFTCYVIMDSVHPIAYQHVLQRSWQQVTMSWYVFFFQVPFLPELSLQMDDLEVFDRFMKSKKEPSPITEEDLEAYKYTFGQPGAMKHPVDYYRANFFADNKPELEYLGKLTNSPPGLIMYGELDIYLTPEVQEESVAIVANARLFCVKGANHFVQQDDPEAVNSEMRKFFDEIRELYEAVQNF